MDFGMSNFQFISVKILLVYWLKCEVLWVVDAEMNIHNETNANKFNYFVIMKWMIWWFYDIVNGNFSNKHEKFVSVVHIYTE